jgi:hypothetical protein
MLVQMRSETWAYLKSIKWIVPISEITMKLADGDGIYLGKHKENNNGYFYQVTFDKNMNAQIYKNIACNYNLLFLQEQWIRAASTFCGFKFVPIENFKLGYIPDWDQYQLEIIKKGVSCGELKSFDYAVASWDRNLTAEDYLLD